MLLDYDGLVRPLVAIMRSPPTSVAEPFLKLPLQHPLLTPTNTPPGRQYCAQRTFKQRACREYVYWLTTATGEVCSLASAATWTETGSADYFQEEADSAYANPSGSSRTTKHPLECRRHREPEEVAYSERIVRGISWRVATKQRAAIRGEAGHQLPGELLSQVRARELGK
jgi:hypothetical protein